MENTVPWFPPQSPEVVPYAVPFASSRIEAGKQPSPSPPKLCTIVSVHDPPEAGARVKAVPARKLPPAMVTPWIVPLPSIAIGPAGVSPSAGAPKLQSTVSVQLPPGAGGGVIWNTVPSPYV